MGLSVAEIYSFSSLKLNAKQPHSGSRVQLHPIFTADSRAFTSHRPSCLFAFTGKYSYRPAASWRRRRTTGGGRRQRQRAAGVRLSSVHGSMALLKKSKISALKRALTSKTLQGMCLYDLIAKNPVGGSTGLFYHINLDTGGLYDCRRSFHP